tara:strand:+ start:1372 stop:3204 length:1833 start_codon:yes stop_codon:yes gene_type:complete
MASSSTLKISELDFNSIKQNLKTYMRSQTEFADYDFDGSSISVLLDILAYNTHYNAFYLNMLANEMFLDSALLRSSVVSRAKALGYTPRSVTGTSASVDLQIFPTGEPATITVDKNTDFTSVVNNISYTFNTTESTTIAKNSNNQFFANGITLKQGVALIHTYTANTLNPDQKFILPNSNTDTSTLTVKLKNSVDESNTYVYNKISDVTTVNSTSNVYYLNEGTDGRYEVSFGDGVLGRKIASGNIVILDALVCEGTVTNGASEFSLAGTVGGYSNVTVATVTTGFGGADRESIDSVKFNAPKNYETQNRAVTVNDYKRIVTSEYSDAQSITTWGGEDNDPPVYGKVFIAVKPKSGLILTAAAKDAVRTVLASRKIVTVTPEVIAPDYIYLNINSSIKYDSLVSQNSAAVIADNVKSAIVNYGATELNNFDLRFRYSKLTTAIDNVDPSILGNLTTITLTKKIEIEAGVATNYGIKFSNEIYHPNDTYVGSIVSTTFTYDDGLGTIQSDCSLDDEDSVLRVVKTVSGSKVVVANNIGTVSYSSGLVNLVSFAPPAISGNTLNITITSASNDITPVREQILVINTEDVTTSAIADNTDATGSVTTSSSIGY